MLTLAWPPVEPLFYGVSTFNALLAIQTDTVISRGDLSVCVSVWPSVLLHIPMFCLDKWTYDRAVYTSRKTIILVLREVRFI